jgi:hypothetical protein
MSNSRNSEKVATILGSLRPKSSLNIYYCRFTTSSIVDTGLVKDVRKADKDIAGLRGAVEQIEKNRLKFPHIKEAEIMARKKFVEDMQVVISGKSPQLRPVSVSDIARLESYEESFLLFHRRATALLLNH